MNHTLEISVIVPVYNVEKVLPRCIESILGQTYSNFELLLIDDGSPDGSGRICDEYAEKDARIRVFHKKNGGVSSARNYGIKEAKGNYLFFVDSDDWVESDFFSTVSIYFGQYDMLFFGGKQVTDEGKVVDNFLPKEMASINYPISDIVFALFEIGLLGYMWSMAVKRSLIQENKIQFREEFSIHEDSFFCYYCLQHADYVLSLDIMPYQYVVAKGGQSLSSHIPDIYCLIVTERISLMEYLLDYLKMPLEKRIYILGNMKYWAWGKCLDWACGQPDVIGAIKYVIGKLWDIRDFKVKSVKAWVMRWTIQLNNPYVILICKNITRMVHLK